MSQRSADKSGSHTDGGQVDSSAPDIDMRLAWALVAGLSAVMLGIFYESTWSLIRVWINSRTYGHGFLIIPIAIWLAWQDRDLLIKQSVRPSLFGVVWIFGACVVWLFGEVAQANIVQHLALVGVIQGLVIAVMGVRIARILIFPLGYLLFLVPFGDFAIAPLQDLTARYATVLLRLSGVPVYLENWSLVIPGGAFLVAEACAGVRFLIASVALGVLIAGTMFDSWTKRVIFIALSIVVPIGANVVRAYGIVVIAHVSNFEMAVGVDHLVYGFIFLSFVMFLLIGLAWFMRDRVVAAPASPPISGQVFADPDMNLSTRPMTIVRAVMLGAVAVVLGMGIRFYGGAVMATAEDVAARLVEPQAPAGWQALGAAGTDDWHGDYYGADAQGTWGYEKDGRTLSVFIAFYGDEGPGKELVSTRNSLLGSKDAKIFESGRRPGDGFDQTLPPANYIILNDQGRQRVVWYWYILEDGATAREPDVKLAGLAAKLSGRRARGMVVAFSSLVEPDQQHFIADFIKESTLYGSLVRGGFEGIVVPDVER